MPDVSTAFELRAMMYRHLNLTLASSPPRRVLFYLRQTSEQRLLVNVQELVDIVSSYGMEYTYVCTTST